jgi:WD40 repeat protein
MSVCAILKQLAKTDAECTTEYDGADPVVFSEENKIVCSNNYGYFTYNVTNGQRSKFCKFSTPHGYLEVSLSSRGEFAMMHGYPNRAVTLPNGTIYETKWDIKCMTFSPDGSVIALGLANNTIHLLQHDKPRLDNKPDHLLLAWRKGQILAVKFENDTIVGVSTSGTVQTYNARNKCISTQRIPLFKSNPSNSMSEIDKAIFSPVDNGLIACSYSRFMSLHVYNRRTECVIQSFERWHPYSVYAFFPDGKHLTFAGDNDNYFIHNVTSGDLVMKFRRHNPQLILKLCISPMGTYVAALVEHSMIVWNLFDRELLCAVTMTLLELGVGGYVVRDIINMLHATCGGAEASFNGVGQFFGAEKFKLIARVQELLMTRPVQ